MRSGATSARRWTRPSPSRGSSPAIPPPPALFPPPIAPRPARRLTRRYTAGTVRRIGATILLDVPVSVTLDASPRLGGCTYYESALRELLQLLGGGGGAGGHVRR